MRLRFTPRAIENLNEVAEHVESRSPIAAERVISAIHASLQNLLIFPYSGRLLRVSEIRRLVTARYPYLVYYYVDEFAGEVVILNVKHPARERDEGEADWT